MSDPVPTSVPHQPLTAATVTPELACIVLGAFDLPGGYRPSHGELTLTLGIAAVDAGLQAAIGVALPGLVEAVQLVQSNRVAQLQAIAVAGRA